VFAAYPREPLIFVIGVSFRARSFPPSTFSQAGERPIYVSFFSYPIAFAILVTRFPISGFREVSRGDRFGFFFSRTALSLHLCVVLFRTLHPGVGRPFAVVLLSQAGLIYYVILDAPVLKDWSRAADLSSASDRTVFSALTGSWILCVADSASARVGRPIHVAAEHGLAAGTRGVLRNRRTSANFCGLFLVVSSTAFLARRESYLGVSRTLLNFFLISVLSLAIFVAFSR